LLEWRPKAKEEAIRLEEANIVGCKRRIGSHPVICTRRRNSSEKNLLAYITSKIIVHLWWLGFKIKQPIMVNISI
jgi:cell fate (sporulation/competence/biofilm development) regulator YmcA (YheA/YmcA/DUF963 family)